MLKRVTIKHNSFLYVSVVLLLYSFLQAKAMSVNSLVGVDGSWIGDGSDGATLSAAASPSSPQDDISIASATRGTPFNVMFDGPIPSTSIFFEVDIAELNGNIAIGVVKKDEFLPGWKTKGMFYNGNVINGIAALIVGFGDDSLKANDKVGVYLQRETTSSTATGVLLQTVFYINGVCLGPAFRLLDDDDVNAKNQKWYPCIHVSGETKINFHVPEYLPETIERQSSVQPGSYVGDWKLMQLSSGPELGAFPLPEGHVILLTFHEQEAGPNHRFRLVIKVANSMNCQVEIVGKLEAFDEIRVGRVASTMMLPSPELREVEKLIAESLPTLSKMILTDDNNLIMTGPTVEFIAERYSKTFEPLSTYSI